MPDTPDATSTPPSPPKAPRMWRWVRRICLLLLVGWLTLAVGGVWLTRTLQATLLFSGLGLLGVAVCTLLLHGVPWRYRPLRRWGWRVCLCAGWIGVMGSLLPIPKAEVGDPAARVVHRYPGGEEPRRVLPMPLPEMDQIRIAAFLGEAVARLRGGSTEGRMRNLLAVFEASNAEFVGDPLLADSGSALGGAWQEVWSGSVQGQGYYLLMPETVGEEEVPVLLFLHGFGGNLQAYRSAFVHLARRQGMAVVLPTLGMGRYRDAEAAGIALACLEDALAQYPLDEGRVFLGGMSMGGVGVGQVLQSSERAFAGVVLVSAVLDAATLEETVLAGRWVGMPVYLLHGERDTAVPYEQTRDALRPVRQGGAGIHTNLEPEGDHLLLFAQASSLMDRLAAWMRAQGDSAARTAGAGEVLFVQDRAVVVSVRDGGELGEGMEFGVLRENRFVGRVRVTAVAADTADAEALPGPWDVRPGDWVVRMR